MEIYVICGIAILFDVITGVIKGAYQGKLNSTIARKGLYYKITEILALVLAGLLEYATAYINIGIDLPLVEVVGIYIFCMELLSILENLCAVNPNLRKLFKPYLEKLKGVDSD